MVEFAVAEGESPPAQRSTRCWLTLARWLLQGAWARVQVINRRNTSASAASESKGEPDSGTGSRGRTRSNARDGASPAKRNGSGITISRRQFWEVFTDYSQIRGTLALAAAHRLHVGRADRSWRTDQRFLALPIEYYDHFAPRDGELEVKQLLLLMALFCNATLSDQLSWMFDVFDTDGDGSMNEVRTTHVDVRSWLAC